MVFNKDFLLVTVQSVLIQEINPPGARYCKNNIWLDARNGRFCRSPHGLIIRAGTYKANTIKVAEAAKVIENTQRDLNIALVNELAMIFDQVGIDTHDVLTAAGTKWNFLPFKPGLVGGHCIGVDPYLTTKLKK